MDSDILELCHGEYDEKAAQKLAAMPFEEAIMFRIEMKNDRLFAQVMLQSHFFDHICWFNEDILQLAEQLYSLRSSTRYNVYHKELYIAFRVTMQSLSMSTERIQEVLDLISVMANYRRNRDVKPEDMDQEEYERKRARIKEQNYAIIKKKKELQKYGLNLPLLQYIQNKNVATATPEELYAEALLYRDKYPSSRAFVGSLRGMWSRLGIKKNRVVRLNNDKRNKEFPLWKKYEGGEVPDITAMKKGQERLIELNTNSHFDNASYEGLQLEPLAPLSGPSNSNYRSGFDQNYYYPSSIPLDGSDGSSLNHDAFYSIEDRNTAGRYE